MLDSLVDRSRQHRASIRAGNGIDIKQVDRLSRFVAHQDLDAELSLAACRSLIEHFLGRHREHLGVEGIRWLQRTAHPLWREIVCECSDNSELPAIDLGRSKDLEWAGLEEALWAALSGDRKALGVYYTPIEIVDYLIEECLAEARRHVDDWSRFVCLDPAAGGGRFVVRFLDRVLGLQNSQQSLGVTTDIVGRLTAFDIRPSAVCATHLSLALILADHHMPFEICPGPDLRIGDTLLGPDSHWKNQGTNARCHDPDEFVGNTDWLMVIGNPPFDSLSRNTSPWIAGLLRGKGSDDAGRVSYTKATGVRSPSKHWLDDDYVKFLRYAHWRVEQVGAGTIGFVLGNGFVDNASFAALRFALLNAFDRVAVVNLHGNTKRGLGIQNGIRDESVFGIEQGIALLLLTKHPVCRGKSVVTTTMDRCDLLGRRIDKLRRLSRATDGSQPLAFDRFAISPPRFIFSRGNELLQRQFQNGTEMTTLFTVSASAIVTARDALVIAQTKEQLLDRLSQLADTNFSTQAIRDQFFPRARSKRYPRGDTRGWTLEEARERLRAESNWERFIIEIDYRPWDRRFLFYASWMVDWPRKHVSDMLLDGQNYCLITRRQMVPDRAANFFWVTSHPTLDGIIRSDNRGNETLYPFYLSQNESGLADRTNMNRTAKCQLLDASGRFEPLDLELFDYLFAMFSSAAYQDHFAECLWHASPRAFPPRSHEFFRELAGYGLRLRELATTTLEQVGSQDTSWSTEKCFDVPVSGRGSGLRYQEGQIVGGNGCRYRVSRNVWEFRVGSHRVARKWYREHKYLRPAQFDREFRALLTLIRDTLSVRCELDEFYGRCGGISQIHHID